MSRPKFHIQQNDLFCKNLCGFFGNPQWGGFCSKCYRELLQSDSSSLHASTTGIKGSINHESRRTTPTTPTREAASSMSVGPGFGGFEEKKKKTSKMGFFKKKLKHSPTDVKSPESGPTQPRTSNLSPESIQIHKVLTEFLAGLSKAAADDVRRQMQTSMESCINAAETASSDEMSEIVQNFYNTFHDRVHSQPAYFGVPPERRTELEDLAERYLTTRLYRVLFTPLSQELEEADLAVQKRIRSLYWVGAELLELNIDETNPAVTELVEQAITDIIEMDSKRTPQDKLSCVSSCVSHLLETLCVGRQGEPPSADDLLPALIFVVLRANPPRLQSNVQYVTRFSSQQRIMSGQQGYDFTNLCCAVSFIESMGADSLGLTAEEYDRYMSGEVLPPAAHWESGQYRCQALRVMETNTETLTALEERQNKLLADEQQLGDDMNSFSESVASSVEECLAQNPLTLRPAKRPAQLDSPAANTEGLPQPLVPQLATAPDGVGRLPSPPPGLLADAQDSLSSVLTLSQMSLGSPPRNPTGGVYSEPPLPPPPQQSELVLGPPSDLPLPPPPSPPPSPPLQRHSQTASSPSEPAPPLPPRNPTAGPASGPPPPLPPPPPRHPTDGLPRGLTPPPVEQATPTRTYAPSMRNIPSIPCSTGAVPVPGGGHGQSEQQQSRRRLGGSLGSDNVGRGAPPRQLPRSLSHTAGMTHRLSEAPRPVDYQPAQDGAAAAAAATGRRVSVTRTEALAQEARRFSQARTERTDSLRTRLHLDDQGRPAPSSPWDCLSAEERQTPAEAAAAAAREEAERRRSVRGEVQRRYSVQQQPAAAAAAAEQSAAATAVLAAECEAAKQRSKSTDRSDRLVKVLGGILSLTDNF